MNSGLLEPEVESKEPPCAGSTVVLEDEEQYRVRWTHELNQSNFHVQAASSFEEFAGLLLSEDIYEIKGDHTDEPRVFRHQLYDAAILDWEIHNREKGVEALELLKAETPDTAAIVITKHEDRRDEAFRHGAVAFVLKSDPPAQRVAAERAAVQLGKMRRLARRLAESDPSFLVPDFSVIPSERVITRFREDANAKVNELFRDRYHFAGAFDTLLSLQWRTLLPPSHVLSLDLAGRLEFFAGHLGVDMNWVSRVLGLPGSNLSVTKLREILTPGSVVFREADMLLSLFSFVADIGLYDQDLMIIAMSRRCISDQTLDPAPWGSRTIIDFLSETGPAFLPSCIAWIRRN